MATSSSHRKSCPTEQRLIMRESFKYYASLIVAGVYNFSDVDKSRHVEEPAFYFPALRRCIETHPMLAAVVKDATTVNESYVKVETVDLHNHVRILQRGSQNDSTTDDQSVTNTIQRIANTSDLAFFDQKGTIPPWRIDVLAPEPQKRRVFISFTYSHCIGDGMSGGVFHKTFLRALNESVPFEPEADAQIKLQKTALPHLPHMPVSLAYLLAPALGHYLPSFLSKLLGVKASVSGADDGTWLGSLFFDDRLSADQPVRTVVETFSLEHTALAAVLDSCRRHQTKLTSLLNELIALCISQRLPKYYAQFTEKTNLVSCIPTNIRKAAEFPDDTLGIIASAAYSQHPITRTNKLEVDEAVWTRARTQSEHLAHSVVSLKNQPIGLLAWISNMRAWMEEKMGQQRDSSWQLSNLMAFEGGKDRIFVEKMFFGQPADAVGIPLNFNTISVKGGDLVICVTWQPGAVGLDRKEGVDVEKNERELVLEILEDLRMCLKLIVDQ